MLHEKNVKLIGEEQSNERGCHIQNVLAIKMTITFTTTKVSKEFAKK